MEMVGETDAYVVHLGDVVVQLGGGNGHAKTANLILHTAAV